MARISPHRACRIVPAMFFLLTLIGCGPGEGTPAAERPDDPIADAQGMTNIRLARAEGDNTFTEVKGVTRAPDHLGQRIPFVYQMEGPAWENENVGFRLYFDERNAIDIFGKLKKGNGARPRGHRDARRRPETTTTSPTGAWTSSRWALPSGPAASG